MDKRTFSSICTVGTIVPKESGKTIEKAVVFCAYDYNSGYALFDNISLRQEPVQTYIRTD